MQSWVAAACVCEWLQSVGKSFFTSDKKETFNECFLATVRITFTSLASPPPVPRKITHKVIQSEQWDFRLQRFTGWAKSNGRRRGTKFINFNFDTYWVMKFSWFVLPSLVEIDWIDFRYVDVRCESSSGRESINFPQKKKHLTISHLLVCRRLERSLSWSWKDFFCLPVLSHRLEKSWRRSTILHKHY